MNLYNELCSIARDENVLRDEPMSAHTTFRIGGPADYLVMPENTEEIRQKSRIMSLEMGAISWWETEDTGESSYRCRRI